MKFKKTYNWNKIKTAKDALLWSIAKWQLLYNEGYVIKTGEITCACCELYLDHLIGPEDDKCSGCPISGCTNFPLCIGTPFNQAAKQLAQILTGSRECSKLEVEFLIKVYEQTFDKFSITEFKAGPYKQMREYLLEKFSA